MHAVHGDRYREPLRHGHRRVAAAGVRLEAVQALPELGDQLAARRVHRDALLAVARDAPDRDAPAETAHDPHAAHLHLLIHVHAAAGGVRAENVAEEGADVEVAAERVHRQRPAHELTDADVAAVGGDDGVGGDGIGADGPAGGVYLQVGSADGPEPDVPAARVHPHRGLDHLRDVDVAAAGGDVDAAEAGRDEASQAAAAAWLHVSLSIAQAFVVGIGRG